VADKTPICFHLLSSAFICVSFEPCVALALAGLPIRARIAILRETAAARNSLLRGPIPKQADPFLL
jgi:hypothetical protein